MLSRTRFLAACAPFVLSSFALSNTWIVDDDGGVGVDFTDIQPALDQALSGDVILVRAGTYSTFTVRVGVVLIGQGGVDVAGAALFSGLEPGTRAALVDFDVEAVDVLLCSGRVFLEGVRATGLGVSAGVDVRARDVEFVPTASVPMTGLILNRTRVELVGALARGTGGLSDMTGAAALTVASAARVHAVASDFRGGEGGFAGAPFQIAPSGGSGIDVALGSSVLVAGGCAATGGAGGTNPAHPTTCSYDGFGGYGAEGLGSLFVSASTLVGGSYDQTVHCSGASSAPSFAPGLSVTTAPVPEPTLGVSGPTFAGTTVVLTLTGEPGSFATLYLGRKLVIVASGSAWTEQLVSHERTIPLGAFPASGVLTRNFAIPAAYGSGFLFGAQAEVQSSIGLQRTNSLPIVVR